MLVTIDLVAPERPLTSLRRVLTLEADSQVAYELLKHWALDQGYHLLLEQITNCFTQPTPRPGSGVITSAEYGVLIHAQWHQPKPATYVTLPSNE